MPIYDIQTPDGKIISIEGARQPSMDEIKSAYANYKKVNLKPLTEEQKAKPKITEENRDNFSWSGFGEGSLGALESIANGFTLGGYDWLNRQFGRNPQDLRDELQRRADESGVGFWNTLAQGSMSLGGGLLGLPKLTGTIGSKLLGSKAWGIPAGAVGGGADALVQSSFDNDFSRGGNIVFDALTGAGFGGLGGALGEKVISPLTKYVSADAMTKGLKGGLKNVADNPQALKIANEAVRKNDDIAQLYLDNLLNAADDVNRDSSNLIRNSLARRIDVPSTLNKENLKYSQFMKEHGQDQLLNPKSAKQQAKENFNKWFKGSQIVDEAGEPLVVYHGTNADFDAFDPTKSRANMDIQGSFFSPWELDASGYGANVQPYYLNIKNPANGGEAYAALNKFKGQNEAGKKAKELLESKGYDGVISHGEEYIAFYPDQIKSVKNSGGWSKSPSLTDPDWVAEPSVADLFDGFNVTQKKALNKALKEGAESTNSKIGSLDMLNEAKKKLNDYIGQAYKEGNNSNVFHLEGVKERLDNVLGKGLKGRDRTFARAKRMEDAFEKGKKYNPNNIEQTEYMENFNPLEKNAFAQGLMKRVTHNPLTSKNLSKKALDYNNTFREVLPTSKYNELRRGLNKNSVLYERLANIGARAENKLRIPEGSRVFLREQLEETTPQKIGLPALGAMLDEALYRGHKKALNKAAKNLLDPTFEGVKDAWLIENYPTLNAYISGALANE